MSDACCIADAMRPFRPLPLPPSPHPRLVEITAMAPH